MDYRRKPSAEYRYFLYDPEGDGMVYFRTPEARDEQARKAISAYCIDDGWQEEIEFVAAGELTNFAQLVDRQMCPADKDLDEDRCDGEGNYWPEDVASRGDYGLIPLPVIINDLLVAAEAVIERWDTPVWKDAPATANYINALRTAIMKHRDIGAIEAEAEKSDATV